MIVIARFVVRFQVVVARVEVMAPLVITMVNVFGPLVVVDGLLMLVAVERVFVCVAVLGSAFNLVVAVLVVVCVRRTDLFGMGVVVGSLGDDVVLLRSGDREVEGLVLLVLVVVGVVLVAVHVL